jgi:hypothetical protein
MMMMKRCNEKEEENKYNKRRGFTKKKFILYM